jgi:hypothetical protein
VDGAGTAYIAAGTLIGINPNLSGAASLVYTSPVDGYFTDVAVDAAGKVYAVGWTNNAGLTTTPGAFQPTNAGGYDLYIAKFDPAQAGAASLVYATYLGGSDRDGSVNTGMSLSGGTTWGYTPDAPAIAVDGSGHAYVTGYTHSANFPATAGAYKRVSGIAANTNGIAFVSKLNATGTGLVYSTFLGTAKKNGTEHVVGTGIAVDAAGNAYLTGMTGNNFPLVNATQRPYRGRYDAYVAKLNAAGSNLLFATYLGGTGTDAPRGLRLDGQNNVYVGGLTLSNDFPTTAGSYRPNGTGGFQGFVAKISGV